MYQKPKTLQPVTAVEWIIKDFNQSYLGLIYYKMTDFVFALVLY